MEKCNKNVVSMRDTVLAPFGEIRAALNTPELISPLALAFIGDAVYEVYVRAYLINSTDLRTRDLHTQTIRFVRAKAQAVAYKSIAPMLTSDEMTIYKRGRNSHNVSVPKSASAADYHSATGLEALVGYLFLANNDDRLSEIMSAAMKSISENNI